MHNLHLYEVEWTFADIMVIIPYLLEKLHHNSPETIKTMNGRDMETTETLISSLICIISTLRKQNNWLSKLGWFALITSDSVSWTLYWTWYYCYTAESFNFFLCSLLYWISSGVVNWLSWSRKAWVNGWACAVYQETSYINKQG